MSKRFSDLIIAVSGLILLSPLMLVAAVWIKLDSSGPIIFRQLRVGRHGVPFHILKFRTMSAVQERNDLLITKSTDSRITGCGALLRKLKIDELPQLLNVLLGHMSIVGPRPEVMRYVDQYPESAREKILSIRPGITDSAAILFRNEGELLAAAEDPEREYVENILPVKISLYEEYVDHHSLLGDFVLIYRTAMSLVLRR